MNFFEICQKHRGLLLLLLLLTKEFIVNRSCYNQPDQRKLLRRITDKK